MPVVLVVAEVSVLPVALVSVDTVSVDTVSVVTGVSGSAGKAPSSLRWQAVVSNRLSATPISTRFIRTSFIVPACLGESTLVADVPWVLCRRLVQQTVHETQLSR